MLSRVSTTSERTTAWPALAGGPQFVAIDPNGNLTSKVEDGHSWSYEWNAENQLKRVLKDAVEVARFSYDPFGRRVEKAASVTASYVYDGEDTLRQTIGSVSLRFVHGPGIDEPLATENGSGQLTCEHADGLGSELKVTDASGAVTFSRSYDAFGQLQSGGTTSGFAFTGREWDAEVGLAYYRARYYDPKLGVFISQDPVGYVAGPNLYKYVDNDPVNWIDPSGETKGGKQNISVTHGGKTLTKKTPLAEIEACLAEAIEKVMSNKHIQKLEGLAKVVRRGGAMVAAVPFIIDGTIAEVDRAKRCGGVSCVQEQYCKDLKEEGNPDFVIGVMGPMPNPCKCGTEPFQQRCSS